jgi:general secretion pathway protein A
VPSLPTLEALRDPLYERFYGLREQPFAITTDPRFYYLSASHRRAFAELLAGLRRREGLMLVTGETGTGKTTLCRAVIDALGERTFAAMVLNPYMSGAEVFRIVLRDFGLVSHDELRRGVLANADVAQLVDTLEGFLRSLAALDSYAVIVIDEAQSVAAQTLDQIRMLTALEHHGARLVQVILCGQPGLLGTLATEPMHALNERITRRVSLAPLAADEVSAYIQHRLTVAGGVDQVSFDATATRVIADLSHGLPRRVNVLCDRSLQEGRIDDARIITGPLVARAARALTGIPDATSDQTAPAPIAVGVESEATGTVTAAPTVASGSPLSGAPAASSAMDDVNRPRPRSIADSPEVPSGTLTFGQIPGTPRGARLRHFVLASIGAVATAIVLGLGYYGYAMVADGYRMPPSPAPPSIRGDALGPRPVPAPADIPVFTPAPAPRPTATPADGEPAAAPAAAPDSATPVTAPAGATPSTDPSGQLPDNRNQVN